MEQGCITDRSPNISFALDSDVKGESLLSAVITIGDWEYETTDQINNLYSGELEPFSTYNVHVTATGTSGQIAVAETSFETGRLGRIWQGKWITDGGYDFPKKVSPVPMTFKRAFTTKQSVRRAWINATALGVYELMLNGDKVGTDYFAPGFTSYDHQIQYQTYDVSGLLGSENMLIAVVAGAGQPAPSITSVRTRSVQTGKPFCANCISNIRTDRMRSW